MTRVDTIGDPMRPALLTLPVIAVAFATTPVRAQQFDGVWDGTAGKWSVKLTVAGTKGRVALSCDANAFVTDVPVSADGAIDAYVTTGTGRRQITGKLPALNIPPGGSCGGGSTTLTKAK